MARSSKSKKRAQRKIRARAKERRRRCAQRARDVERQNAERIKTSPDEWHVDNIACTDTTKEPRKRMPGDFDPDAATAFATDQGPMGLPLYASGKPIRRRRGVPKAPKHLLTPKPRIEVPAPKSSPKFSAPDYPLW